MVVGTRPEVIKLAPVVASLGACTGAFEPLLVATSQHREMLAQALAAFGLRPTVDLDLNAQNRGLAEFTGQAVGRLGSVFREVAADVVLVQGDTSTAVAGALAAFYEGIPVAHVEAGLRSHDLGRPFPEEGNRKIVACVAALHFAPTRGAAQNLLAEGIPPADVHVTGNTVVDAMRSLPGRARFDDPALDRLDWDEGPVVLATVHRRESLGAPLRGVCAALRSLAEAEGARVLLPIHPNPAVRAIVEAELAGRPGVLLLEPLGYPDLLEALRRCRVVLTDSGGLQEEAAALGKPVLILRSVTERPEVVEAGFGRLVGVEPEVILSEAWRLLRDDEACRAMTSGRNPFGDGRAAARIADLLAQRFGVGRRTEEGAS